MTTDNITHFGIEKFNIHENTRIKEKGYECPSFIVYGPRGSGKTFLTSDIIYQIHSDFDIIYLFSNTAHLQKDVFKFIPVSNKIQGFNEDILSDIVENQKQQVRRSLATDEPVKKIIIVFDDVISNNKIRASDVLNDLYISGRHLRISPFLLSQSIGGKSGIPIVIRDNADVVFSFYPSTIYDKSLIYERYLSMKDKKQAQVLIEQCTHERFHVMVICNNMICQSRNYEDYIYTYLADKTPEFKIGFDGGMIERPKKKTVKRLSVAPLDIKIKVELS